MGAFLGFFLGCCVVAWSVFFVGRRIARVLWALLVIAEKDERQRAVYIAQYEKGFKGSVPEEYRRSPPQRGQAWTAAADGG